MSASDSLDQFMESLEQVPFELQRNFTLMRDLDTRAHSVMKEIDDMADDFLKSAHSHKPNKRKERMKKIEGLFGQARAFADDKIQIAFQSYELVDKHIRKLDSELARLEAEIQMKTTPYLNGLKMKKGRKRMLKKEMEQNNIKHTPRNEKMPLKKKSKRSEIDPTPEILPGLPADVLNMPVDPNEPTYCLCHQVSYGEMIGCDNPDCPIEWFHFPCVGITTKPKGKWFCKKCLTTKKKP